MSIKYKIALLFTLLATLIMSVAGVAVYVYNKAEQQSTFKTRLKNRAISTARLFAETRDSSYLLLQRFDSASSASLFNRSTIIVGIDKVLLYRYADVSGDYLDLSDTIMHQATGKQVHYFNTGQKKAAAIYVRSAGYSFIVAIAAEDLDGQEFLLNLKRILIATMVTFVFISFGSGILFARRIVSPIRNIAAELNMISSNNLSQRIEAGTSRDELHALAETCNKLLDRLQDSFIIQRRFVSNASHELSTPLTVVSSQLEIALHKNRTAGEYRETIESVYDDIKGLNQLTKSLLDIAKTGTGGSIDLAPIRVDEVLLKVAADVQKLNTSYKVLIDFETFPDDETALTIYGNANLLYIALKNIIENGCKYSSDQVAEIIASFREDWLTIKVSNKGDVIAESDLDNIFQPFFRTEAAQQKEGFGLGLTLTRRIISLHKGTIDVVSSPDLGTVFTIKLPIEPA